VADNGHSLFSTINSVLVPIHPEGHRFIAIFAIVTLVLFWVAEPIGWIGVILTLWCTYFFRNPARVTPNDNDLVISPADGVVQMITEAIPPPELDMGEAPRMRISVFMNVFNVHVNRVPAHGEITGLYYHPGKFLNASLDKASEDNERQSIRMRTSHGHDVAFVQIAGLVARRIVCGLIEGQAVRAGEIFGLIRFGSRVDVFLDEAMEPLVLVGQQAVAGETVLAKIAPQRLISKTEES
jgi:phosphatidylserine decarboxylase